MKKYLFLVIIAAIGVRFWFIAVTNYTAEDAFITFQFARNVMRGDGFSFNPGQPIYGSTTPLLTFLLAGWLSFNKDVVLGSRIIDLVSAIAGIIFLFGSIKNKNTAIIAVFIISLSSNLYINEMQGMEMPLLFLFLAASYFGFVNKQPVFSGIMAGLMLWTRADAVFWVGCLFIIFMITDYRQAIKYFIATTVIYLPWIIFSWIYFGSPVPFTIIAKQVAYSINNPPYSVHLQRIINYIGWPIGILFLLSIPSALRKKEYWLLVLFAIVETTQLVLTGSTFFLRYFYLLDAVCFIVIAIGITDLLQFINIRFHFRKTYSMSLIVLLIACLSYNSIVKSSWTKSLQDKQQEVLIPIGEWFNTNTPPESTILLEHIGYIGWYADRPMFDEVGMVTPKAVDLHVHNVPAKYYYQVFWPNYVVWSCSNGGETRNTISKYYDLVKVFDGNYPAMCFEIRARKPNFAYILP